MQLDTPMKYLAQASMCTQEIEEISENLRINLSVEDLQRIYQPWKFSLIIKLMGKRIIHQYFKRKIH